MNSLPRKIDIHKFSKNGRHFLLDVKSSVFMEIDKLFSDVVDLSSAHTAEDIAKLLRFKYPEDSISEAITDLGGLFEMGLMREEKMEHIVPDEIFLNCLHLNISHDCNMACRYCFVDEGTFGEERNLMNKEVAEASIDYLFSRSGEWKSVHIIFFGGEPLMNFKLIQHVVPYAKKVAEEYEKGVSFGLTTNGTLFSKRVVEYLTENHISALISIDGPPSVQDRMRPFVNGKASYQKMLPGLLRYIEAREGNVAARVTMTTENMNLKEIALHLLNLGFSAVHIEPVSGVGSQFHFTKPDIEFLKGEFDRFAEYYLDEILSGRRFGFFNFHQRLRDTYHAMRKLHACTAGKYALAVSTTGEFYPCPRFVGMPEHKMGDVFSGHSSEMQKEYYLCYVDNMPKCKDCWSRYLCGGSCIAESYEINGSIDLPHDLRCDLHKHVTELSVMIYSTIHSKDKQILDKLHGTVLDSRPHLKTDDENKEQ